MVPNYEFKTTPYRHQGFEGALANWNQEYWAFLLEMGTGKSKIFIDNVGILFELNELDICIIVAPKGVYANWVNKEIPAHLPDRIRERSIVHLWTGGHTVREKEALKHLCTRAPGMLRIFVVNIEAISMSKNLEKWITLLMNSGRSIIGIDEASTIKNPDSIRTKSLISLGRQADYRRIMTGTPVSKGPLDLWSQFEFLERACLGHRSFYTFKHRYGVIEKKTFNVPDPKNPGQTKQREVELVVNYRDVDKLSKQLEGVATIIRKEDCLDLPEKIFTEWTVDLSDEQRRIYDQLKKYATAEIDDGKFVTTTAVIAQLLRLHQVVCGHTKDEHGEFHTIPTKRPAALLEIMEQIDNKVIVWCTYKHDIELVNEALTKAGYATVTYDGSTSERKRAEAIWRFQGKDFFSPGPDPEFGKQPPSIEADVFIGNPSAGGYGITLTAARNVIYYSNSYDLEKRLQSEDRAHRIGQKFPVTYIDMIARGTVDEKIIAALKRKEQLADIILDGPARLRDLFS